MSSDELKSSTGEIICGIRSQKAILAGLDKKRGAFAHHLQEAAATLSNPESTIYQPAQLPAIPTVQDICDVLNKMKETKESIIHLEAMLSLGG